MVSQILNKMGNLASSFLPSILQIILSLLSTCVFALEQREKVSWYRWINTCVSEHWSCSPGDENYGESDFTTALIFYPLCDKIHTCTSYATLSSGIPWNISRFTCVFWYTHSCVYQKIQVTSWIFHDYTTRKGSCLTILCHAIENTVAGREGWVWYIWIAVIDGKARWNTANIQRLRRESSKMIGFLKRTEQLRIICSTC